MAFLPIGVGYTGAVTQAVCTLYRYHVQPKGPKNTFSTKPSVAKQSAEVTAIMPTLLHRPPQREGPAQVPDFEAAGLILGVILVEQGSQLGFDRVAMAGQAGFCGGNGFHEAQLAIHPF